MRTLKVGLMSKLFLTSILTILFVGAMCCAAPALMAQDSAAVALSGVVSSPQEGLMEGVVVNARRDGANFTVSVVSDAQGKYSFPRTHLAPGKYALTIRAVGYDLIGPKSVEIAAGKTANADLKLDKTKDLGSQLSSIEWAMSIPGTPEQKDKLHLSDRELRLLPCLGTHHEVEAHGGRVPAADHPHAVVLHGRDGVQQGQSRARTDRHARPGCCCRAEPDVGPRTFRDTRRRIWPSISPR